MRKSYSNNINIELDIDAHQYVGKFLDKGTFLFFARKHIIKDILYEDMTLTSQSLHGDK